MKNKEHTKVICTMVLYLDIFGSAQSLNSFPGKAIINSANCSSVPQLSMACHV